MEHNDDHGKGYELRIDKSIIDNLGLKLYDKISAVVAELIANSYDADAEKVEVCLPLGVLLASKQGGTLTDNGHIIQVIDDGYGMTPKQAQEFYLMVGKQRRDDPKQGDKSRDKKRLVMGRKGIGKLAPFGVCRTIEIRSAGGDKKPKGYEVTHFELDYDEIIKRTKDNARPYNPKPLADDRKWDSKPGTTITLRNFYHKRVPDKDTFSLQLSSRFGLRLPDFEILVKDNKKENPDKSFVVGEQTIKLMPGTKINVDDRAMVLSDGTKMKVTGWVGMAQRSYKNDEFAGIRIYVRGKIASITRDFGLPAGFSGEFVARSYLVGEIHADWLDDKEDLIQTHRQDILWSSDLGRDFAKWGQELIKEVAKKGREPRRENVREVFLKASDLGNRAHERFNDAELEKEALEIGKQLSGFASEDELDDDEYVKGLSEIILMLTPHKLLFDAFTKIKEMAKSGKIDPIKLVRLFETTKIAQLASYGQIIEEKLTAIDTFRDSIRRENTSEPDLQKILEAAPWLIKSEWIAMSMNQTLTTFQSAFAAWYKKETGEEIVFSMNGTDASKRPDFIFLHEENGLIVVEIKPPKHTFDDEDWGRLERYHDNMEKFFEENKKFEKDFPNGFKVILITDKKKVSSTVSKAMANLKDKKRLEQYTWEELLRETERANRDFLQARDKMQKSKK